MTDTAYTTGGLAELQDRSTQRHAKSGYIRTCDQCGAEFVTCYSRKLRCSWECQQVYHAKHMLAAYRRRKASAKVRP